MTFVTTGLTNNGQTAHYQIQYDNSLSPADGKDRANALIDACENDFSLMKGWFGGIDLTFSYPITVQIAPGPFASASWGPPIVLKPGNGSDIGLVRYLLVSEVVEMFMLAQNKGWYGGDNEGSAGEGFSRFLAAQFLIANGLGVTEPGFALANSWMTTSREDFVNNVDPGDNKIDKKTGCAILFIYYLNVQLGFSINELVSAASKNLSGVYKNLTGDLSDPFPYFKSLLDDAFPGTTSIPGSNPDNPYPLGSLSFVMNKSTFGKDEVQDVLSPLQNGTFPKAFWLTIDGFNTRVLAAPLLTGPSLSGAALNFPGISITLNPSGAEFEFGVLADVPQRVRLPFDIKFSPSSLGGFPAKNTAPFELELDASMIIAGKPYSASTLLEFTAGADPYFTNVDPAQHNVFYMSQDLRVFTATPALNNIPVAGGPLFLSDSVSGAYSYIQQLISYLNVNYTDPTGVDLFSSVLPGQTEAYTGSSSVTPTTVTTSDSKNGGGGRLTTVSNYNFALARVRLRGGTGEQANDVRTFFRLWSTQTADTDYQTGSTYPSHLDSNGLPDWPLPVADGHTIPFFATSNNPNLSDPNNPEYGTNGVNNRTVTVTVGDSCWAYFGCFLNIYDPANTVNGAPVQSLLTGTHHCIVAQIAYDDAPIINANGITESPENSDKLAQRNLEVTLSSNPGSADTHRIPQTFDLRPSLPLVEGQGDLSNYPDELVIDWGNTPQGSTASIYWPQVNVPQLLLLASRLYGTHQLTAADNHTIHCKVGRGVTYVPLPPDSGQNFAGLLTVDLPKTVSKGEEFNIVLQRISTRRQVIILRSATETKKESSPEVEKNTPASRKTSRKRSHSTEFWPHPGTRNARTRDQPYHAQLALRGGNVPGKDPGEHRGGHAVARGKHAGHIQMAAAAHVALESVASCPPAIRRLSFG